MLRLAQSSTAAICRVAARNVHSLSAPSIALARRFPVSLASAIKDNDGAIRAHSSIRAYSSSPTSSSSDIQGLVIKTVAELMQINEPADREKITLKSHMKSDLGMDIFKTYQLLDRIERELESIDIPIEAVDKAETLEDIADIINKAQARSLKE
ncbi:hypothetical protein EDD21DRAFT_370434 [Dissophora ornata]|nr:hypothetical protein BGZ58_005102 [Dissophora ornata]KAI8602946.1 hypothetical protein EDD21DRAFT_370434 [Dissophora ornata]